MEGRSGGPFNSLRRIGWSYSRMHQRGQRLWAVPSRRLHGGQGYQGIEQNAPRCDASAEDEVMAGVRVVHAASLSGVNLIRAFGGNLPHRHRSTQWAQSVVNDRIGNGRKSWGLCAGGAATNEDSTAAVACCTRVQMGS